MAGVEANTNMNTNGELSKNAARTGMLSSESAAPSARLTNAQSQHDRSEGNSDVRGEGAPRRMRVLMYSAMPYEIAAFRRELQRVPAAMSRMELVHVSARLDGSTVSLASGATALCLFVKDTVDATVLNTLRKYGVRLIVLRYSGTTSVDLEGARRHGIRVARAPSHAPTSVAEYAVTLMLTLNRKVHLAANRVRDGNMALHGLVGFDMESKTVGVLGTGKVGGKVCKILKGFGCRVLAYDTIESKEVVEEYGAKYVSLAKLLAESDIISLHAPLLPGTYHLIGSHTLPLCKRGVHIINTSRGALVDKRAMIESLKTGQVGGLAMDVYEGESTVFFKDHSGVDVYDVDFQLLQSMPNVLITGHQSALTENALEAVAKATVKTLLQYQQKETLEFEVFPDSAHGRENDAQ